MESVSDILVTPLNIISVPSGDVLHGLKKNDAGYAGFGEAYFSTIDAGAIKAWKRHREMTMNLIVPAGEVRFVIYDDRSSRPAEKIFHQMVLSRKRYFRLTVPPMVWMGFQGLGLSENILLNISNIKHSDHEIDRVNKDEIAFNWNE